MCVGTGACCYGWQFGNKVIVGECRIRCGLAYASRLRLGNGMMEAACRVRNWEWQRVLVFHVQTQPFGVPPCAVI